MPGDAHPQGFRPHISQEEERAHLKSENLGYVAEGNANVVYAFKSHSVDEAQKEVPSRRLLRMRKDKSFIRSTKSQSIIFQQNFVPLFRPGDLVEHKLISVDQALINDLNKELQQREATGLRPNLRHGDRLASDDYALLMTDMTAQPGEYCLEIKPKWLLQSPDAPEGSIRCRTCALKLQRDAAKAHGAVVPRSGGFCPFSLVDSDLQERQRAFEQIISSQIQDIPQISVNQIAHSLASSSHRILLDLRRQQEQFDEHGLLSLNINNIPFDYSKAMTLRDCVLFVKGSLESFTDTAEIRLADLDFKHPHPDKVAKWQSTESALIEQGWYTDLEADIGTVPICLLTRRHLEQNRL